MADIATETPADEPVIEMPDPAPADPAPAPAATPEPTPEEKAAEEARRAALTEEERAAEDAAKAEAEAKAKEEAEAKAKQAPEKYEPFKLPEGVTSVAETLGEFEGLAKKHNLSQDAAQEFVDMGAKLTQRFAQQQQDLVKQARVEWTQQSLADKEFGGEQVKENVAVAEGAIKAYTTPEFRKFLKDSGLSQHPEMIRTFYRVGKAMQPDRTIPARSGAGNARDNSDEARAARLYGGTAKAD